MEGNLDKLFFYIYIATLNGAAFIGKTLENTSNG